MKNPARIVPAVVAVCLVSALCGCTVTRTHRNGATRITIKGVTISEGGSNSANETVQKRFKADRVTTIKANSESGSIEVEAAESNEIHVQALKTVHGADSQEKLAKLLPSVSISAELVDGALVVSSTHPADFATRSISVSVDYVITVPARLAVQLSTGSGAIKVHGTKNGAILHSSYGALDVQDVSGSQELSSGSGSISIHNVQDAAKIDAKTDYGSIDLERVTGAIDAHSGSGSITLSSSPNVPSSVLRSSYGKIEVSDVGGSVDASSGSGSVEISKSRLSGHLKLHSEYGKVSADGITGVGPALAVDMAASSGSIEFSGDASEVTLKSSYGGVNAELGGGLVLDRADLESSSGPVSLALPAACSAKIDASTSSGNITLPEGGVVTKDGSNTGSYTSGSGAAPVKLQSGYGSISVTTK